VLPVSSHVERFRRDGSAVGEAAAADRKSGGVQYGYGDTFH